MDLGDEDIRAIAKQLAVELRASKDAWWVEPEVHATHHRFMSEWLQARAERRDFWRKVKQTVLGGLIVGAAGWLAWFLGTAVWEHFVALLKAAWRAQS